METTDETVARNLVALRKMRGHTVRSLSEALDELGHRLLPSGITKIERQERGVSVADLVALAAALRVNPNRLLFPFDQDVAEDYAVTPKVTKSIYSVWLWATGAAPLETVTEHPAEEIDEFWRSTWPTTMRLANEKSVMKALRRLEFRLFEHLTQSQGNVAETRRALKLLIAEVEDLIGEDDAR